MNVTLNREEVYQLIKWVRFERDGAGADDNRETWDLATGLLEKLGWRGAPHLITRALYQVEWEIVIKSLQEYRAQMRKHDDLATVDTIGEILDCLQEKGSAVKTGSPT